MNATTVPSPYATATAANAVRLERLLPGPVERERFLGLELRDGALAGVTGVLKPAGALVATEGMDGLRRRAA